MNNAGRPAVGDALPLTLSADRQREQSLPMNIASRQRRLDGANLARPCARNAC